MVEVFDEGPAQRAELIAGSGEVHFAISTASAEAQKFFDQGVGQLHGDSLYEAERSFHEVAALDPDCAMAYWGMALANVHNHDRAKRFMWEAFRRRKQANLREQQYIEAYARVFGGDVEPPPPPAEEERRRPLGSPALSIGVHGRLLGDLDAVIEAFPDDVEARALRVREQLVDPDPLLDYEDDYKRCRELLSSVLAERAQHPAIRYPYTDLSEPWRLGLAAPALPAMWRTGGKRYGMDHTRAAWMFEAAIRAANARMARTDVTPCDVAHYFRDGEALYRRLIATGRVRDAIALTKAMIGMPRHPFRRAPTRQHSQRLLLEALGHGELWNDLIAEASGPYLVGADAVDLAFALGHAHAVEGRPAVARPHLEVVDNDGHTSRRESKVLSSVVRAAEGDREQLAELTGLGYPTTHLTARFIANDMLDQVLPRVSYGERAGPALYLAARVWAEWKGGQQEDAKATFAVLRKTAGHCDLDLLPFARLAPIAQAMGLPADWRTPEPALDELHPLPTLDAIGPARWSPPRANDFKLPQGIGRDIALADYRGTPVLVVFFLGFG